MRCDFTFAMKYDDVPISTHAPRVRCDAVKRISIWSNVISTHAPRVRCDKIGGKIDEME